jgi:hypothetical protein
MRVKDGDKEIEMREEKKGEKGDSQREIEKKNGEKSGTRHTYTYRQTDK